MYQFELKLEDQQHVTRVWVDFYRRGKRIISDTYHGLGGKDTTYYWEYNFNDAGITLYPGDTIELKYGYNDWRDDSKIFFTDTLIVN